MRILQIFAVTLCLLLSMHPLAAQSLQQTNGPEGGTVYCIEQVGNAVWAGTNNGIYSSVDEGVTWQQEPLASGMVIHALIARGDSVLVLGQQGETTSVFRSVGGAAFQQLPAPDSITYPSALVYLQGKLLLFPGMYDSTEALISNDFGLSWTPYFFGNSDMKYITHPLATDAFCAILWFNAAVGHAVMSISTDGFNTWTTLKENSNFDFDTDFFWKDSVIVVNMSPGMITRSIDHGKTWTTLQTPHPFYYLYPSASQDTLMAELNGQSWYSVDYGSTWALASGFVSVKSNTYIIDIIKMNSNELQCWNGLLEGFSRATGAGFDPYHGIIASNTSTVRVIGNRVYTTDSRNLLFSDNGGTTWEKSIGLYSTGVMNGRGFQLFVDPADSSHIFMYFSGDLYESFDNAANWTSVPTNIPTGMIHTASRIRNILYFSGSLWGWGVIHRLVCGSTAEMDTYQLTDSQGVSLSLVHALGYFSDSTIFIVNGDQLYVFNGVDTVVKEVHINGLIRDASTWFRQINDTAFALFNASGQLFVTHDAGNTWQQKSGTGLPVANAVTQMPTTTLPWKGHWLGYVPHYGLYQSDDEGEHWQLIQADLPFALTHMAAMGDILFFASANAGVWRTDSTILASMSLLDGLQMQYTIYPNPVRDRLSVRASGPMPAGSVLILSDMTGREQFRTPLAGAETELALPSLPGGLYLCRVVARGKVLATGRVMVE